MNAIRYRWDGKRMQYIVEVLTEQPDGTVAAHMQGKHDRQRDAAEQALKLREERTQEQVNA